MPAAVIDDDIDFDEIRRQSERVRDIVGQVREQMLAPDSRKMAPMFSTGQVMALTGLDKAQFDYQIKRGVLPAGTLRGGAGRREFSLGEVLQWVRYARSKEVRPEGARAVTMTIGNFKGGVTKTTTAMTLAQGLSLRGHRVLLVDCDPQGSLTSLFGLLPDTEVNVADTILPLLKGDTSTLQGAVRHTYWDGIDLVAAAPVLFAAEFAVGVRHAGNPDCQYWDIINRGLDALRDVYDVIILDTPPSLSYVTINALMASDGIIMPLPPSAMDFASSAQFWMQFKDVTESLGAMGVKNKTFSFISVLPTKVESTDQAATAVLQWMGAAYADRLLPVEIPKSAAMSAATVAFGTIFDGTAGSTRTVKRATDAFDRVIELVEDRVQGCWAKQLRKAKPQRKAMGVAQ